MTTNSITFTTDAQALGLITERAGIHIDELHEVGEKEAAEEATEALETVNDDLEATTEDADGNVEITTDPQALGLSLEGAQTELRELYEMNEDEFAGEFREAHETVTEDMEAAIDE